MRILLAFFPLCLFAQSFSDPAPASLVDLKHAATIRPFQVPEKLIENPIFGTSTNILKTKAPNPEKEKVEPIETPKKKLSFLKLSDLRIMVGPRGLAAFFLTYTFGKERSKNRRLR